MVGKWALFDQIVIVIAAVVVVNTVVGYHDITLLRIRVCLFSGPKLTNRYKLPAVTYSTETIF